MSLYPILFAILFILLQTIFAAQATTTQSPTTTSVKTTQNAATTTGYIPKTTLRGITTTSESTGGCYPECNHGNCVNSTCVCDKLFQGEDCKQPKPWFLAVVCVAGTIVLLILFSCLCCLFSKGCNRCGKKVSPE